MVKLAIGGKTVTISQYAVKLVFRKEYEKYSKDLSKYIRQMKTKRVWKNKRVIVSINSTNSVDIQSCWLYADVCYSCSSEFSNHSYIMGFCLAWLTLNVLICQSSDPKLSVSTVDRNRWTQIVSLQTLLCCPGRLSKAHKEKEKEKEREEQKKREERERGGGGGSEAKHKSSERERGSDERKRKHRESSQDRCVSAWSRRRRVSVFPGYHKFSSFWAYKTIFIGWHRCSVLRCTLLLLLQRKTSSERGKATSNSPLLASEGPQSPIHWQSFQRGALLQLKGTCTALYALDEICLAA